MINTSKLFGASATALWRDAFFRATIKLTAYYVLCTAVILCISSVAIVLLFASPETELPFREEIETVEVSHDEWSLYEMREHLVQVVVSVNVLLLALVSLFSYYFARRTLMPIKVMHEKQRQFLGDVAHELRTPLSVLLAGAETMLTKSRTITEYQAFVTDVQEEANRLSRLSNQLLRLLRTEKTATIERVQTNVSAICAREIRRFAPYAEAKQVSLTSTVPESLMLTTAPDSFIEIVQNLLKNAVDYNVQGGSVTLSLSESALHVQIAITDTGVGIPPEKLRSVFKRFVKVEGARTQSTGSGVGLGLSIVEALVTSLGGMITLHSTLRVGTTVTVTLPKQHS